MKVEVSLSIDIHENFTYELRNDIKTVPPGTRVLVPFGNRVITGWIIGSNSEYRGRVKPVIGVIRDNYIPSPVFMEYVLKVSDEFFVSAGKLLDTSMSPSMRVGKNLLTELNGKVLKVNSLSPTELKKAALEREIDIFYKGRSIDLRTERSSVNDKNNGKSFNRVLKLEYKTSDFYKKTKEKLKNGNGSVLILLPGKGGYIEDELISEGYLPYRSEIKMSRRETTWTKIVSGENLAVFGTGTSLFLPFPSLEAIVIERPGMFTFRRNPFSVLDPCKIARIRAETFGVHLIERDSTFTVENYNNRDFIHIDDSREENPVEVICQKLKPGAKFLPSGIIDEIVNRFYEGQRLLILTGKTVSSVSLYCPRCKKMLRCPNCGGKLKISDENIATCNSCGFRNSNIEYCDTCNSKVISVGDISIESLEKILSDKTGEKEIEVIRPEKYSKAGDLSELGKKIIISNPGIIKDLKRDSFSGVYFIKPESYFYLNDFNGAEAIFSSIWNLKPAVSPGGTINIISVFHFHYVCKNINSEKEYFTRELKYRKYFLLPPFLNLYRIEIRNRDIRGLGKKMRLVFNRYHKKFNIRKSYIISRKKIRGYYRGSMELHTSSKDLRESGLLRDRDISMKDIIV